MSAAEQHENCDIVHIAMADIRFLAHQFDDIIERLNPAWPDSAFDTGREFPFIATQQDTDAKYN